MLGFLVEGHICGLVPGWYKRARVLCGLVSHGVGITASCEEKHERFFACRDSRKTRQLLGQQSNCCRSRKSIRGHIPMHNFLPVTISRLNLWNTSLLPLQTKTRRYNNSFAVHHFQIYIPETSMCSAVPF